MKPTVWLAALAAMLAGLTLIPAAALGAPPERVPVCHFTADAASDGHRWTLIEVSVKTLDKHLAHGDGIPGGEVPGRNDAAVFDEDCAPQEPETEPEPLPDPEPEPSELVFAVAYSDIHGDDGGYQPAVDVLLAKLIDGPGDAGDGLPGVGDLIITHRYPMDFGATSFGEFTITEHVVTRFNVGFSDVCNMQSGDAMFVWSNSGGTVDFYHESVSGGAKTEIVDAMPDLGDSIQVSSSSPSEPMDDVALLGGSDPTDQTFIDVEANCAIDGA